MRLWVFSDLHLTETSSSLYASLLKELDRADSARDHVVFAGDIFDLMVGDSSYFFHKFRAFFEALKRLHGKGVKLYYVEGNHDFHLAELLKPYHVKLECTGVELQASTKNGMRKILVEHGDLVDQEDHGYLALRKLFRSKPVEWLAHHAPGALVQKIGTLLSRPLAQKHAELPDQWTPERREALRKKFREYASGKHRQGIDYIVLGHCHDLDQIEPFYFNMGYPPVHRQFVYWESEDDVMKRLPFP